MAATQAGSNFGIKDGIMPLKALVFLPLMVMLVCYSFLLLPAVVGAEYGPQIEDVEIMLSDETIGDLRGKHLVVVPWPAVFVLVRFL